MKKKKMSKQSDKRIQKTVGDKVILFFDVNMSRLKVLYV